ncbi:diacylglycerol acyltransferase type 2B [Radiomyces spectabilis]|uniref:diacylglycerol acyltransferase type 2B n=1 Tax=Radiomyces spectabilis TaxID=64574 RepID=UPI00221FDA1E|nr:diacylglycerol acyltransferase type 2B [Radiomyces spectabilis]KAI8390829.1 diacylglycerol acyltransferase type 2B [Radiomyces spectabilis]
MTTGAVTPEDDKSHATNAWEALPRMAPLRVPLRRRLQTLALFWWGIEPAVAVGFFLCLCTMPVLWPILIIYLIWMLTDKAPSRGGRRSVWIRNWRLWKYFVEYFPVEIVKTSDLDPSKNYIFGYHPHGIIAIGAIATFSSEGTGFSKLYPGIHASLLTLASNFNLPLHRDYLLACGLCSVSKDSCKYILKSGPGRSIAIVVGGATESLNARPGVMDLTLKKRFGFVKIAVQTGANLVPVLSFGENEIYDQVKNEKGSRLRLFQKRLQQVFGFTMPLFHGRGVFNYDMGLMPHRRPMNIVIGEPIEPPKDFDESNIDKVVQELHAKYIQSLKDIYEKYKDVYFKDRIKDLEFVE